MSSLILTIVFLPRPLISACSVDRTLGRSRPLCSKGDPREARGTKLFHFGHVVVSRRVERTREGQAAMMVMARTVKAGLD